MMLAPELVLWTHALSALLFGGLAVAAWRAREANMPRHALAGALGLTALWALAMAGIGGAEMVTRFVETLRNLAWLGFMAALHRRDSNIRPPIALGTVYGVVAMVAIGALLLRGLSGTAASEAALLIDTVTLQLRMLVAVASLVLVRALHASLGSPAGAGLRWIVAALAGIWCADLSVFSIAYLTGDWESWPLALRGAAMVAAALAIGIGLKRKGGWSVQVSRTVAYQSLSLVAIGAYLALLALATWAIAAVGGENARVLQTAFVFGSTAAVLTLLSNGWLRAWIKVKLAKHFFRHRYDYRSEWMRFTETLGAPEGGAALEERIVKAIADLTDSPGGVLLVPDPGGLVAGASWNWDRAQLPVSGDPMLAEHLHGTGRIVDLDAARAGQSEDLQAVPQWMLNAPDAWVLVPLPHLGSLAGAILLARPPVSRPLDWEDFDLLRVAGRQVASYLAEGRAHQALAEAQRFDEFNRRFAFILHDIKNLVSQLTLTARNAERHADKPEFRADMVATLKDSAERMNALLARLSQHHRGRSEAPQAIDIVPVVHRIAAARRAQHPIATSGVSHAPALADPAALEQLLGQLVQNAIEASPANEPVTLAVAQEPQRVVIDVIDAGCGMSPGFIRDQLFKPFVSSKPGGFGIGAFEALQLAQQMQGQIEVTSQEGRGSRFRVILKAALPGALGVEQAA